MCGMDFPENSFYFVELILICGTLDVLEKYKAIHPEFDMKFSPDLSMGRRSPRQSLSQPKRRESVVTDVDLENLKRRLLANAYDFKGPNVRKLFLEIDKRHTSSNMVNQEH